MSRPDHKKKLALVEEMVIEGYKNNHTLRELADLHGVATGTVRNLLVRKGVDLRRKGRRRKGTVPGPTA